MQFLVSTTALLKSLQSLSGVLSSSSTLPILQNFLFEINGTQLKVSASDLETTISAELTLEKSEKDWSIAIPARLLLETLKSLPEQPLNFSIDEQSNAVELSSEVGKYKLVGQNADDFPQVPVIDSASSVNMESSVLYSAIEKTLFATNTDNIRPIMCGINCSIEEDRTTFVATDAHKLVKYTRTDAKSDTAASMTLPKKPMNLLKALLPEAESDILISFNDTNASFEFDQFKLICRLIDGKYPDYESVIPKNNPCKLIIDRVAMLNSIRRVSIFANKTTYQILLRIAGSELQISAEDIDFSNEANERLNCNYEGEDIEIAFNSKFLIEMLSTLESENIVFELSQPNRAGIILPADKQDENEEVLMLIMPVMINR